MKRNAWRGLARELAAKWDAAESDNVAQLDVGPDLARVLPPITIPGGELRTRGLSGPSSA